MNARATPFYTRRFISGINTKFSRVLHTQKLKYATYKHMRCAEYMHVQYCICIHTAYISATLLHILGMYTAYILHTCTPAHVTHVCCTHAAHTIHPYCMHARTQKLVQHHTHAIQAYEEMYAVCVQLFTCSMYAEYINNCMYASHNNCTHLAQMCATSCACMWHACGAEPIFMYAAYIQYGCIVCAARVQRICTVCAARKQIYVQHTSNLSVRVSMGTLTIQWYCACAQSRCIAIVHRELF